MNVIMQIITKFALSSNSACIVSENKVQPMDAYIQEISWKVVFIKPIHLSSFKGFINIQITINFIMNKQPVAKLITCDGYYFLLITY